MRLSPMDRAFLTDIATYNWLHHFVVAAGLVRAGAEDLADGDHPLLDSILARHNMPENLALWERAEMPLNTALAAHVQALMAIRVFQERVSAIETLGTLLVALGRRRQLGVAQAHFTMDPGRISKYLRGVVEAPTEPFWRRIDWPSLEAVAHSGDGAFHARCERVYPKFQDWITQLAEAYAGAKKLSLGSLGHPSEGYDPRTSVFVILHPERFWKEGSESDWELLKKAYNMVKHAFNATTVYEAYEEAAKAGPTAIVLEIPKRNEVVQQFGKEVDLMGVLAREIARMTLELDDRALLA